MADANANMLYFFNYKTMKRPQIKDFFPEITTLTDAMLVYSSNKQLFSYATALNRYIDELEEKRTIPADMAHFMMWVSNSGWYFDTAKKLWCIDGYRNRTTQELFEYYLNL